MLFELNIKMLTVIGIVFKGLTPVKEVPVGLYSLMCSLMDRHTSQMALGGAWCQNDCRAAAVNVSRQRWM